MNRITGHVQYPKVCKVETQPDNYRRDPTPALDKAIILGFPVGEIIAQFGVTRPVVQHCKRRLKKLGLIPA